MPVTRGSTTRSGRSSSAAGKSRPSGSQRDNIQDTSSECTEAAADEPTEWDVKRIIAKKVTLSGAQEYLVEWAKWSGPPTWEPEENCIDCPGAIDVFESAVARRRRRGTNNNSRSGSHSSERSPSPPAMNNTRSRRDKSSSRDSNNQSARSSRSQARARQTQSFESDRSDASDTSGGRQTTKSFKRTPDKTYRFGRRS